MKVNDCVADLKSKKFLKFILDDRTSTNRAIFSGINAFKEPEVFVSKTLLVTTNLPQRERMGIDSCGMLLSAIHTVNDEEQHNLVMFDGFIPEGAKLFKY